MQLLDVLSYLHNHSIAHRDLKLENILCRFIVSQKDGDGVAPIIKLADFGFAVRFNDGKLLTERCGSEEYAAPEIIRSQPYDGRATDIWALGVILYALVTGGLPFLKDERKPRLIYQQIILSQFVFPSDIQLSDQVKDLIRRILEPDSSRRLSESIIRSHSWLLKGS
jgi:serine/threonine protein kinase